jgi:hypothetical protein
MLAELRLQTSLDPKTLKRMLSCLDIIRTISPVLSENSAFVIQLDHLNLIEDFGYH